MDALKLVVKQNILNIKQVILNKMNIIFLSFIIVISLLIPMVFIPLSMAYPIIFLISLIPVNGSVFSTINFNLKKSTLNKNYNITKSNRWVFNISTILTMVLFSFVIFNFIYVILIILNQFGILLSAWRQYPDSSIINSKFNDLTNIGIYSLTLYTVIIISLITFSISFFISHFISSQKTYFMFILTSLILAIVFGGAFNDYFYLPWDVGAAFQNNPIFPKQIYWVTLIFPYGPSGQLLRNISRLSEWRYQLDGFSTDYATYKGSLGVWRIITFSNTPIWNFTLVMPYIQIITFGSLGIVLSKRK